MRIVGPLLVVLGLFGCATTDRLTDGKPTEIKCRGKGAVMSGTMAIQADCTDGFEFSINVR